MRALALVVLLVVAGCGADSSGAEVGGAVDGRVTVFAAASLTETFTRLGEDFEAAHPGVEVVFNFGGSSALAQQINQGAPADVFASAAPANMTQVGDAGGISGAAVTFARNRLEIAVPKGNPAGITGLADFGDADAKIALCAEQVPCGAAAKRAFEAAGVTARPDTLEQDVKAVLTKVRLGEVDAALVYRTDVRSTGEVEGIEFPEADRTVNDYPIAPLAKARNAAGARAFIDHVRSDRGRAVLAEAGFDTP
ncbi:molybdate ABC transporter substrate-binding protein [Saccharothrix sp. ALI-22-I]|uniref:molybdate ABC transporter substrate-binding protein n=1 Tax=Saccharothrix sp. ALI-22-I TaxID=1933778 RepID=UPI00097C6580|nr:molybdate ABC transporter substrate-binding protein [Saccharothrix sp. ALI-22-I]ONI90017.1 molybdate ABC transporter substrate-binding protein [Saccharothrix sp. ALI-22-I]